MELIVVGVFVGEPADLGIYGRERVLSAIAKQPVTTDTVVLRATNLDGDRQADLVNHGGRDKAVYLYPSEHYDSWRADGYGLETGGVGENVAVRGGVETDVRIGDVWQWGSARIQISQPRQPCFKLAMRSGNKAIVADMVASGRCGWYARVVREGEVPVNGTMQLINRDDNAPTVAAMFTMALQPGVPSAAEISDALRVEALSDAWKHGLRKMLART